jgi:hypothetical protein
MNRLNRQRELHPEGGNEQPDVRPILIPIAANVLDIAMAVARGNGRHDVIHLRGTVIADSRQSQ